MHPGLPGASDAAALRHRLPEIELAAALRRPAAPSVARHGDPEVVLIRLHSIPIGLVLLDPHVTDVPAVTAAIDAQLGPDIRRHLAGDGLPGGEPAGAAPWRVPPEGLPWPEDVPCLARRRRLEAASPPVTVVVPVADRPDRLETCLADLAAQSHPAFTVVVVDNAPARSGAASVVDAAIAAWNRAASRSQLRYVAEPRPGSSRSRNRGLEAAMTDITAFVDSDVRIDRDWLVELVAPLVEDGRTACATGLVLPAAIVEPGERLLFEWGGYDQGFEPRVFEVGRPLDGVPMHPYQPGVFGSGQSMAFRTSVLRSIGGFDLALGIRTPSQGGEDQAAMLDVVLDGHRLAYAPAAIVWHPDPADEEAVIRKLNSYGVGLTALLTRVVAHRPGAALRILARMPGALSYFFRGRSGRNRRHSAAYPRRAVWTAELRGMAWGPFAYALAVLTMPRRRRAAARPSRRLGTSN